MSSTTASDSGASTNWLRLYGRAAAGLSQLVLRGGKEIADLVAEMHSVIARVPWIFDPHTAPDARLAPLPYRIVSGSFSVLAELADALPRGDDRASEPDGWRRFTSALNGVMGDKLAAWDNALAIALTARAADGSPLDLSRLREASPRGVVLFAHGLCFSELNWQTPALQHFVSELEAAGYGVGWLRYNSGRAIHENGREFADLLEEHFGRGADAKLILIGHSMGGLLIRSACHVAATRDQRWLARLTHAAYLGSPHHGAPLERAGQVFQTLLGLSPYSAAFTRLGEVRSQGIKDLRFGCVTDAESAAASGSQRPASARLPGHVRHLLLAASRSPRSARSWVGDGFVPVASALAEHPEPHLQLSAPDLERVQIEPLDHVAILGDERVYETLRRWLAAGA